MRLRRGVLPLVQVVVRHDWMSPGTGFEQGDEVLKCFLEVCHGLGPFLSPSVVPVSFADCTPAAGTCC